MKGSKSISIIALIFLCADVCASHVLKVGSSFEVIAITQESGSPWHKGDRACVIQERNILECGSVMKIARNSVIIRLDNPNSLISLGDLVRAERAAQYEYQEELGIRSSGRKPAAKLLDGSSSVQRVGNPSVNLSGGICAGGTFFFPMIHLQIRLTSYVAFGLEPLYFKSSTEGTSVGALGGYFTINYYGNEYFRGFWAQVGGGVYSFFIDNTVESQEAMSTAVLVTLGWRGYWDLGLNVGVGVGAQYVMDPRFQTTTIRGVNLQPLIILDVGFNF